jgi:hypothetical protein
VRVPGSDRRGEGVLRAWGRPGPVLRPAACSGRLHLRRSSSVFDAPQWSRESATVPLKLGGGDFSKSNFPEALESQSPRAELMRREKRNRTKPYRWASRCPAQRGNDRSCLIAIFATPGRFRRSKSSRCPPETRCREIEEHDQNTPRIQRGNEGCSADTLAGRHQIIVQGPFLDTADRVLAYPALLCGAIGAKCYQVMDYSLAVGRLCL